MIQVYGTTTCPWCVKLVEYLSDNGVHHIYSTLSTPEQRQWLKDQGITAVPAVFLNGQYIGGHDQTIKLHKEGKLK